jgi:hypothetical protein
MSGYDDGYYYDAQGREQYDAEAANMQRDAREERARAAPARNAPERRRRCIASWRLTRGMVPGQPRPAKSTATPRERCASASANTCGARLVWATRCVRACTSCAMRVTPAWRSSVSGARRAGGRRARRQSP